MPPARRETGAYTVQLSREHAALLESLGELYHAAPERLLESCAVHWIEAQAASMEAAAERPGEP
ncbi:hypothetical protein D7D52_01560 [Nocardia yunnanensis]|uniref:CopG family transcriptional regulator n=1 Tax=Nocardia yunnanensis TaxID=2382165 RepID=A0A386Z806_9NOCA|nr:hypothetical protein [Nocardia yunnanensis]AYF72775.1 hypothetical protein D7D52_01560 [Nocardia yunnanensis]